MRNETQSEKKGGRMGRGYAILAGALLAASVVTSCVTRNTLVAGRIFRAGAYAMDVTPTNFPVVVNGGFLATSATQVNDPLHVRWLVLDDGATRLALGVLDTCLIPVEFADAVKARAQEVTGIPSARIMLSATHTHSAPSLMQVLGTPPDPNYPAFALPLIVEGLRRAVSNLAPARVGWAVAQAPDHTHTRVWIRRPDKLLTDPFGALTVRANMHPGHQNPAAIGPTGPSDSALTLLAVQTPEGRPVAVLANYAMHYFGSQPVSADYYGAFARQIGPLLGATNGAPAFVGILSQGTSGDQHWMDYSTAKRPVSRDAYATELAQFAADAYKTITFQEWVPLSMRKRDLRLATRQPDAKRLAWARTTVEKMGDRLAKSQAEVYAREQLWLNDHPTRDMKLQAVRVGGLGIAAWPCEVFALHGLQVKAQSPFQATMNIALANAEEGYILPPELHPLGGYNTWACRSAMLETESGPKIVEALTSLLEEVGGQRRRSVTVSHGAYAQAVLAAQPLAYWRLEEWGGATAFDATASKRHASYGAGIARWLDGPASPAFSGSGTINRCAHLAGGHLTARVMDLKDAYTAEMWFWNGLPNDLRPVTGFLFARGGDRLAIGGTNGAPGRLMFGSLAGRTVIQPKTWNHVALVRDGAQATVYLNGNAEPELAGSVAPAATGPDLFFGGAEGRVETFEGKIDEVALYGRALTSDEIGRRVRLAVSGGSAATPPPAPLRAAFEAAVTRSEPEAGMLRPLRIVLLADRKDHGTNEHDYPLWQERWALLLGGRAASAATQINLYGAPIEDGKIFEGAANVTVERAWGWPSDAQFATADVIVAFCYLPWTDARKKQVADYLGQGRGLVVIHSATWTKPKADPEVAALTGVGGFARYRHGKVRVELTAPEHPLCRDLPKTHFLNDEPYWPPVPAVDSSRVTVLAVSQEKEGAGPDRPQPLFWAHSGVRGRTFGCVPGHYSWTFDDPWFRLWILRGIAWAAGESPCRLDGLALRGARVTPFSSDTRTEAASVGTAPQAVRGRFGETSLPDNRGPR